MSPEGEALAGWALLFIGACYVVGFAYELLWEWLERRGKQRERRTR